MLTRLIYASRVGESFAPTDIRSILDSSAQNNTSAGVTGVLYFGQNYFFQCLEGERAKINYVYNKIVPDHRHTDCVILGYAKINERLFEGWDMAYLSPDDENIKALITKYSPGGQFNAYELSEQQADYLILDFSQALAATKKTTF